MNKIYIVTFNSDINFNKVVFHNYMTSLYPKYISDWWHHIENSYLIASALDVNSLYNLIFPGVPKRYLLVIEIDPSNAQGWLPKEAWDWLQKYQHNV
jgi:hypothetical protein